MILVSWFSILKLHVTLPLILKANDFQFVISRLISYLKFRVKNIEVVLKKAKV